ncbi:MAG: hypothetical protein A3A44_02365 [Candidatus Sungbacteria bacterium RIFCSPLOWO2_01_FULL_60_25]|uniref:Uncharacterized protein n=1 Tax=Candidatus Sungbacteria bacterium RIFCSPLOWO2_01_FULL_60_25 TaxID=1802281 RepID=A0A1G2LDC3_9BACT|nr:MAG: hypothetical protein A3A44_02365 [Candidatus Sungbacteria bacterium RIFCSPLOWO2_01_FULL_60_25]
MPVMASLAWSEAALVADFTHDPGEYTRTYALYLKRPADSAELKFASYERVEAVGASTTLADGSSLARIGPISWQWSLPMNYAGATTGDYIVTVKAVGDGNVEGMASPGRIAILRPAIVLDDLLEGPLPAPAITNATVTKLPLTVRIKNPYDDLYYRYALTQGTTKIWETSLIRSSSSSQILASFPNNNNYIFATTTSYQLRAESYDNDAASNSTVKQPTATTGIKFAL